MREWLSWWSTTLPRSGSRVRVPSRALEKTFYRMSFFIVKIVEEMIIKLQEQKAQLAEQILRGEGVSGFIFSREELLELLENY